MCLFALGRRYMSDSLSVLLSLFDRWRRQAEVPPAPSRWPDALRAQQSRAGTVPAGRKAGPQHGPGAVPARGPSAGHGPGAVPARGPSAGHGVGTVPARGPRRLDGPGAVPARGPARRRHGPGQAAEPDPVPARREEVGGAGGGGGGGAVDRGGRSGRRRGAAAAGGANRG